MARAQMARATRRMQLASLQASRSRNMTTSFCATGLSFALTLRQAIAHCDEPPHTTTSPRTLERKCQRVIECFPSFRNKQVAAVTRRLIQPDYQADDNRIHQDENLYATLDLCVLCKTGAAIRLSSVLDIDQCSTMQMNILNFVSNTACLISLS